MYSSILIHIQTKTSKKSKSSYFSAYIGLAFNPSHGHRWLEGILSKEEVVRCTMERTGARGTKVYDR